MTYEKPMLEVEKFDMIEDIAADSTSNPGGPNLKDDTQNPDGPGFDKVETAFADAWFNVFDI